jgi:hypothetical protein
MPLAISPPFCSLFSGKINILTTGTNAERYYVTSLCKYCRVHLFMLLDIDFPTHSITAAEAISDYNLYLYILCLVYVVLKVTV